MKLFSGKRFENSRIFRDLREFAVFWREILRNSGIEPQIMIWRGSRLGSYRRFLPRQFRLGTTMSIALLIYTCLVVGVVILGLSRGLIPQFNTRELHQNSVLTSIRLQEIADSLTLQTQYITNIQRLLSGDIDSSFTVTPVPVNLSSAPLQDSPSSSLSPKFSPTGGSFQPAPPNGWIPSGNLSLVSPLPTSHNYLASLQLPVLPPVQGIFTRGFDAEGGHYAVDIATSEGSIVRCIGDGYVIFSDWTYEGGHTIAVQHADGYVSVYKHNQRLLKRTGDRVRLREGIAVSGDSGEYSTGPHLHFELWNNGLAQDPASYFLGY